MTANLKSARRKSASRKGVYLNQTGVNARWAKPAPAGIMRPLTRPFPMLDRPDTFRSPAILSVTAKSEPVRPVFIVTRRPARAGVIADWLSQSDRNVSAVWLPSAASARRRLEWERASAVILGDPDMDSPEDLESLKAAASAARVPLISGHAAQA